MNLRLEDVPDNFLDEMVGRHVETQLNATVRSALEGAVEAKVREVTDELIREKLDAELERVLEEGWARTDTWGQEIGKPVSLKERVSSFLTQRPSHSSTRWVDDRMAQLIRENFDKEMRPVIDDAKAKVAKMIEDATLEKFGASLRKAAGL